MIGSGIFVSPAFALQYSGSVGMCLVVWTVCGIVSLLGTNSKKKNSKNNYIVTIFLGALAFAELGTVIPRSGAEYAYFFDSFGPLHKFWGHLPAFIYSWVMIVIIRPAEVAVIVLTFSEYLCQPILDVLCIKDVENVNEKVVKAIAFVALGTNTPKVYNNCMYV